MELDREAQGSYTVKVMVNDGINDSDEQSIVITVNDINDEVPSIISGASVTVAESVSNDVVLINVNVSDLDTTGTPGFLLVEDADDLFEINSDGELTLQTGKILDFETIQSHSVKVEATDGVHTSQVQTLLINVTDVNDTAPVVLTDSATLSEDPMFSFFLVTVSDIDTVSGHLTFELTDNSSGIFTLSPIGEVLFADGRPASGSYAIKVIANDGINNSIEKTIQVSVPVQDTINNNAPIIDAVLSAGAVAEGIADTNAITTVQFTDTDTDHPTNSFALTVDAGGLFEINSANGEISLAAGQSLDFETAQSHTLSATVSDGTHTSAVTEIVITVIDENDTAPVITSVQTVAVAETALDSDTLHVVTFTDADTVNGETTYTLSDGPFMINASGVITLRPGQSLDYESITSYGLTLSVSDGVHTSAVQEFVFNITDVNDEAPELEDDTLLSLNADIAEGAVIYTLNADDADAGATATYTLTDDASGLLEVDAASGEISIADSSGFRSVATYTIKAVASDGVNISAEQTLTLQVLVVTPNLNTPVVTAATNTVREGINEHSVLHQVEFTDADGVNPNTVFSLTDDASGLFEIDNDGNITLVAGQAIDFSTNPSYDLGATVDDGANTSSEAIITLHFENTPNLSTFDVGTTIVDSNFQVIGDGSSDTLGESVSLAGDFNGDGFDDFIVGARSGDNGAGNEGSAYLVYGKADGFTDISEDDLTAGVGGFKIQGKDGGDTLGVTVSGAGDINGDGFDDLMMGANLGESSVGGQGETYVIYGQAAPITTPINFDNDFAANSINGFIMTGIGPDQSGRGLSIAGDINGDGYDDMLIGAALSDGFENGISDAGEAYLVYGQEAGFSDFNLADVGDAVAGITMYGRDALDYFGRVLTGIGDMNGDGYDDFLISSGRANHTSTDDGEAFVIFGSDTLADFNFDTDTLDGANGFEINGEDASDFLGEGTDVRDVTAGGALSGGGDINGDGFDDLIIGAGLANINGVYDDGAAYILYGQADGFTSIDLNTPLDGVNGFRIVGESAGDKLGHAVAILGDVNGDDFDDIMVNNHVDNEAVLIFGKAAPFAADFNVSSLSFDGVEAVKFTGFIHDITVISGQGDINSDGFADMLIGVDTTSGGTGNRAYTILGRDFSGTSSILVRRSAVLDSVETGENGVTDHFAGSAADDTFINVAGNDSVAAAAGDDWIAMSSNSFFRIDGGNGMDTLIIERSIDLTAIADNRLENIEIIDVEDSGSEVTLSKRETLNLSTTTNTLRIDGINGRVSIFEDGFTQQADVVINTVTYHVFTKGAAVIQIQDGLFPNINANAPTVDTAVFAIVEGETITITTAMLSASDADTLITTDADIAFSVQATGGSFQLSGQDTVTFTLQDVKDGNVTFVHDGSETAPSFTISVSDGIKTSADSSGTFGFTQVNDNAPEMTKAEIAYKVGVDTVLKESMIGSIDLDTDTIDTDMVFTISNLSNGEIKLNGVASSTFNLADLKAGNVTFFDAVEQESTFDVIVTDGIFTSATLPGVIAPKPPIVNLIEMFHITGMETDDMKSGGWDIAGVGDVNGDGYDDFLMGKSTGISRTQVNYRNSTYEEAYLIYGKSDMGDDFDIEDLTPSQGIQITDTEGAIVGFGANVSAAGDLNGDGYADFMIHESGRHMGLTDELYVFYGSDTLSSFDVSTMGAGDGFVITDERMVEFTDTNTDLGYSMSALGDINHDGYDDVIVSQMGQAFRSSWIIYGRETGVDIDLNSETIDSQRVELTTTTSYGAGFIVASAGDINGDGYMDFLLYDGNNAMDRINVIYGSDSLASTMSLESRNGSDGFQLTGLTYGLYGSIAGTAGDFNGDGYDDIIVNDRIVYGGNSFSASASLDSTDGLNCLTSNRTFAISSIGDFDGDGYDDVMVAERQGDYGYIVLGREATADIDLKGTVEALSDRDDVILISNDLIESFYVGLEISHGDFNGDGFDDVILSTGLPDEDTPSYTFLVYGGDYGAGNIIVTTSGTGTAPVENFVGSDGNDSFVGISTDDTVSAGAGNDTIRIDSTDFFRIDGGHGIDTLRFGASDIDLDLTNVANLNKIENIEAINMGDANGSSLLTLTLGEILELSSARDYADDLNSGAGTADGTSDILRIMGDSNDSVDLTDFSDSGTDVVIDGITFDLHTHSSTANGDILIEQGVNVL